MIDPSDPRSYEGPVNRLTTRPDWKKLGRWRTKQLEDEERAAIERWESETLFRSQDEREMYRAVYALIRAEIESGRGPDEIRAGFRGLVAGQEEFVAVIHEAMEDALAGRPPSI